MAHAGTPWTAEEDSLLIQAVAIHGDVDQWKTVSLSVPGRTNKACRKRWLHSLSPNVKKTAWTAEEDSALLALYMIHGTKWSLIARSIPGRTDDACSKRYREALDPALRKEEWTAAEDEHLVATYTRLGGKWGQIGQELQRSGLGCRNRWRMMERKRAAAAKSVGSMQVTDPSQILHSYDPVTQSWTSYSQNEAPVSWRFEEHLAPDQVHGAFTSNSVETTTSDPSFQAEPPPAQSRETGPNFDYESFTFEPSLDVPLGNAPDSTPSRFFIPDLGSELAHDINNPPVNSTDTSLPSFTLENDVPTPVESVLPHVSNDTHLNDPQPAAASWNSTNDASVEDSRTFEQEAPEAGASVTSGAPEISASLALLSMATSIPQNPPVNSTIYYRSSIERTKAALQKRIDKNGKPLRLNSTLSLSPDPTVLPYACGYPGCRSAADLTCFSTSAELVDHVKMAHDDEIIDAESKPFCCALPGCGKSWKSVNGLQYHLQVSKAHFRQAIAALAESCDSPSAHAHSSAGDENTSPSTHKTPAAARKPKGKTFDCPHEDCLNTYKQLSGLRYHLSRAHPQQAPAQISMLPPTLARIVAAQSAQKVT